MGLNLTLAFYFFFHFVLREKQGGRNEEVENKAPLKQGSLKQSLKARTPPSRNLSEHHRTDLLVHLKTSSPKPCCCLGELHPHHEPHARSEGIAPGVSPMKPMRNAHCRLPEVTHPPGKREAGTALSAPTLLRKESFLASSSRGASGFARDQLWQSAVIKSRRLLWGVTGEADTRCRSLGGGRGHCVLG